MTSVRLAPFDASHLVAFDALAHDPAVQRFTRFPSSPPPDFAETWLRRYEEGRRDGTREAFALLDPATGEFLGVGVAPRIDRPGRTAELGYVVAPAVRGRGVATEALGLLTAWGLAEVGALRLELLISAENEASKGVARRCGYVHEGILRSVYVKDGLREDTEVWSRLPTDP